MSCGAVGTEHDMIDDVRAIVTGLKADVEAKSGSSFDTFNPVKYATQLVAGTNYFVKVDVGNGAYIHVRIYKPLPHTGAPPSLHSVQTGKSLADPINHF